MRELVGKKQVLQKPFEKIMRLEEAISRTPGAKFGDDCCPLKHLFGDNLYIREITMARGTVLTSKIHKTTHPYFVMKGDVTVTTDDGTVRIKAPHWGITKAGTKRALYINEETVWVTVHSTKETDLVEIEKEVIAENYEALPERVKREIEGNILEGTVV